MSRGPAARSWAADAKRVGPACRVTAGAGDVRRNVGGVATRECALGECGEWRETAGRASRALRQGRAVMGDAGKVCNG
jgi:hypothetical protein